MSDVNINELSTMELACRSLPLRNGHVLVRLYANGKLGGTTKTVTIIEYTKLVAAAATRGKDEEIKRLENELGESKKLYSDLASGALYFTATNTLDSWSEVVENHHKEIQTLKCAVKIAINGWCIGQVCNYEDCDREKRDGTHNCSECTHKQVMEQAQNCPCEDHKALTTANLTQRGG